MVFSRVDFESWIQCKKSIRSKNDIRQTQYFFGNFHLDILLKLPRAFKKKGLVIKCSTKELFLCN